MARKSRKNIVIKNTKNIENIENIEEKQWKNYNVGVYVRLSKDDIKSGSESIKTQIQIVNSYVNKDEKFSVVDYYIDNGYSGMNFNRPEFSRLLMDIESKKVNCIIVKDVIGIIGLKKYTYL